MEVKFACFDMNGSGNFHADYISLIPRNCWDSEYRSYALWKRKAALWIWIDKDE